MSKRQYAKLNDYERDKDGFIVLHPTADKVDEDCISLTTTISSLEDKLKRYKSEKEKLEKYKETDAYKSAKKKKKKKLKKNKQALLEMMFNNADEQESVVPETEDDEENYKDKKAKRTPKKTNTLESTYGKRFTPDVSLLQDSINDFDTIAAEIEKELEKSGDRAKTMYRSSQTANLISAKDKKLSAIKELVSVAKMVSDLEYKKSKDAKAEEGDTNKIISSIGAKYLRSNDDDIFGKKKKKDKKKKSSTIKIDDDDDEDDEDDELSVKHANDEKELAARFAETLSKKKSDLHFSAHERYIDIEGTYKFVVVADTINYDNDWKFVAVNPKTDKEIKDFKIKYKDLIPKKKSCRMVFDVNKLKATDKNTNRTYKLILK